MHILITQDSKNSCGKAIIQQYMLYTGIQDEQNQQKAYRFPSWGTSPMMIRKIFTITTKRKRKRQTHLSTENIQEYINNYL